MTKAFWYFFLKDKRKLSILLIYAGICGSVVLVSGSLNRQDSLRQMEYYQMAAQHYDFYDKQLEKELNALDESVSESYLNQLQQQKDSYHQLLRYSNRMVQAYSHQDAYLLNETKINYYQAWNEAYDMDLHVLEANRVNQNKLQLKLAQYHSPFYYISPYEAYPFMFLNWVFNGPLLLVSVLILISFHSGIMAEDFQVGSYKQLYSLANTRATIYQHKQSVAVQYFMLGISICHALVFIGLGLFTSWDAQVGVILPLVFIKTTLIVPAWLSAGLGLVFYYIFLDSLILINHYFSLHFKNTMVAWLYSVLMVGILYGFLTRLRPWILNASWRTYWFLYTLIIIGLMALIIVAKLLVKKELKDDLLGEH